MLSIASLIEPFDEGPDVCYEDCKGMCFACYDGCKYSLDWRASYNLRDSLWLITDHELDMLIDALDDKVHKCDEWCSDFICYQYEATSVRLGMKICFLRKKNIKYCSGCGGNLCLS